MEKIPTAKEMVDLWQKEVLQKMGTEEANPRSLEDTLIEFAKLHCEAQAEAIADKAYITYSKHTGDEIICKDSILNSYPLDKIK